MFDNSFSPLCATSRHHADARHTLDALTAMLARPARPRVQSSPFLPRASHLPPPSLITSGRPPWRARLPPFCTDHNQLTPDKTGQGRQCPRPPALHLPPVQHSCSLDRKDTSPRRTASLPSRRLQHAIASPGVLSLSSRQCPMSPLYKASHSSSWPIHFAQLIQTSSSTPSRGSRSQSSRRPSFPRPAIPPGRAKEIPGSRSLLSSPSSFLSRRGPTDTAVLPL